jgi:hypothetical protein
MMVVQVAQEARESGGCLRMVVQVAQEARKPGGCLR